MKTVFLLFGYTYDEEISDYRLRAVFETEEEALEFKEDNMRTWEILEVPIGEDISGTIDLALE